MIKICIPFFAWMMFVNLPAFAKDPQGQDGNFCEAALVEAVESLVPAFVGSHLAVHYPRSMDLDQMPGLGLLIARSAPLFSNPLRPFRILFSMQDQVFAVGHVNQGSDDFYAVSVVSSTRALPVSQVRMANNANHELPKGLYIKERDLKNRVAGLPFQTANQTYAYHLPTIDNGHHLVFVVYIDHVEHKVMTREILGLKFIRIFQ